MMKKLANFAAFLCLVLIFASADFGIAVNPAVAQSAAFRNYLKAMENRAARAGVPRALTRKAFRGLKPEPKIWELSRYQPEFKLPIWGYLDKTVTDRRIIDGRAKLARYEKILTAIERRYGVPRHYLLAVWGMESNYGEKKGDYHVIQALATLGYKGRQKRFGRSQLIAALKILKRRDIPLSKFYGSWAGAMGHTQFIPTTYNAYAVDWTGDGTRDIWNSISDALASTARYLKVSGWNKADPWGHEVVLPRKFNRRLAGIKKRKPRRTAYWTKLGVKPARGGSFGAWKRPGWIIMPSGRRGPAFLVYKNFRAILRYNNAVSYALAVAHLGDRIAGRRGFVKNWPRTGTPLNEAGRIELQAELAKLGFYKGTVTGLVGRLTEQAIIDYRRSRGLRIDSYPSRELLNHIKSGT